MQMEGVFLQLKSAGCDANTSTHLTTLKSKCTVSYLSTDMQTKNPEIVFFDFQAPKSNKTSVRKVQQSSIISASLKIFSLLPQKTPQTDKPPRI